MNRGTSFHLVMARWLCAIKVAKLSERSQRLIKVSTRSIMMVMTAYMQLPSLSPWWSSIIIWVTFTQPSSRGLPTMVWPLDFKSTLPLERWYSASHASMQRPLISLSQKNIRGSVPRNLVMRFTQIYRVLPLSPPSKDATISSPLLTIVHEFSTYTFFIISVRP